MKQFSFAALCCLMLLACQKKDDAPVDASKVAIAIAAPTEGQQFRPGDTVRFRATVSYPSELHGYEVSITNAATGEEFLSLDEHVHTDHFAIDTVWVPALTTATALKATLRAEIDHDGHEATKDVRFSIQP